MFRSSTNAAPKPGRTRTHIPNRGIGTTPRTGASIPRRGARVLIATSDIRRIVRTPFVDVTTTLCLTVGNGDAYTLESDRLARGAAAVYSGGGGGGENADGK
jgi:hypothetical protein